MYNDGWDRDKNRRHRSRVENDLSHWSDADRFEMDRTGPIPVDRIDSSSVHRPNIGYKGSPQVGQIAG